MSADVMADALDIAVRLVAVGLAITGIELIADRRAFAPGGPFGTRVFAALRGARPPRLLAGPRAVTTVATVQVLAAIVLVALGPLVAAGRWSLVVVGVTTTLVRRRRIIGGDGAEQMSDIVIISAILALLPWPGDTRVTLAVAFIAAQGVLSYFVAGVAKLVSPVWRSGEALPAIVGTYNHGLTSVSHLLERRPVLGLVLGWTVILFEVLFPVVLFAPTSVTLAALGTGVIFHVGCALLMGLNSFVWPFPATYACVLAVRQFFVG
jgi:hypothetical protein